MQESMVIEGNISAGIGAGDGASAKSGQEKKEQTASGYAQAASFNGTARMAEQGLHPEFQTE